MAFLLDRSRLQVENATGIRRLLRWQLLPNLFRIIRMQVVIETRPKPIRLQKIMEGGKDVQSIQVDHF